MTIGLLTFRRPIRPIDDSSILTSMVYLNRIVISAIRFQSFKQSDPSEQIWKVILIAFAWFSFTFAASPWRTTHVPKFLQQVNFGNDPSPTVLDLYSVTGY